MVDVPLNQTKPNQSSSKWVQEKILKNIHKYPTKYSKARFEWKSCNIRKFKKFSCVHSRPMVWNYFVCKDPILSDSRDVRKNI